MEQNREPQQPATYAPVYPAPQPAYYAPPQPVKASRWLRFRRMLRLLLIRLVRGFLVFGRVVRPYAAFIVVILALLGVVGWMSYMIWGPTPASPTFERAESLPPAPAIQSFIQGQQSYNADMMWDAYSTDFQASQLETGATKAVLQSRANSERNMGLKYEKYEYIGGVKVDDGSMYFYSVDLTLQNQHARFPMIFRADPDGKIIGIDSPLTRGGGNSTQ
jgi:hypothetical protein